MADRNRMGKISVILGGALTMACAAATGFGMPLAKAAAGAPVQLSLKKQNAAIPVAVFGTDERVNLPPNLEGASDKLGLLFNNRARTVCTAFCVADNLIATAAHCLARGQATSNVRYGDFVFARGYDRKQDYSRIEGASSGAGAQNILSGDFKLRVRPPIDAANDWAIIKLQRRGCASGGFKVRGVATADLIELSRAKRVFQISYHRDWAQWRPAYSTPCAVNQDFDKSKWTTIAPDFLNPERMILHTCDTGGASSGSPLFIETDEGPVVVGINVGTYVQSKIVTENGQVTTRQSAETIANTAVSAQTFEPAIEAMRRAVILTSGAPIREMQERLSAGGFYSAKADGAYGPALKAAIEAYELANRLPVTGLATQALLTRLNKEQPRQGEVLPSNAVQPKR